MNSVILLIIPTITVTKHSLIKYAFYLCKLLISFSFVKKIVTTANCFYPGKPCNIVTYEKTSLNAVFAGWHPDGTEILVRDLETPASFRMTTAILRTPDVLAVEFEPTVELP